MSIPDPIETYLLRLGFEYRTLRRDGVDAVVLRTDPATVWVRTLAFSADGSPVLAIVREDAGVDRERLRRAAGAADLRPATEQELAEFYPESEPGAMPPLGHFYGQRVFIDESLTTARDLVFSGGTGIDVICMRYGDFAALVDPAAANMSAPA